MTYGLAMLAQQKLNRQPSLLAFAALMLESSAPPLLAQEATKKHGPLYAEVSTIQLRLQYAALQPNARMSQTITTNVLAYTCL
jgi:hypothetical protein